MNRWQSFWGWYERRYTLNLSVALGLFLLQILHLIWLFVDVVWGRAFGVPLLELQGIWQMVIVLVDYTEIPALISISLVYANELRKQFSVSPVVYLFLLNTQWLHLFWITDEFVVNALTGTGFILFPLWLAFVAIGIDYLEVPVMIDTAKKFFRQVRRSKFEKGANVL